VFVKLICIRNAKITEVKFRETLLYYVALVLAIASVIYRLLDINISLTIAKIVKQNFFIYKGISYLNVHFEKAS